ncbi:hypothetical protein MP228_004843 [Amoeboaphelidium protococcarum]|nr:hypothetical protein MP228_004843 [Amoeboaphelidium protococcarum]
MHLSLLLAVISNGLLYDWYLDAQNYNPPIDITTATSADLITLRCLSYVSMFGVNLSYIVYITLRSQAFVENRVVACVVLFLAQLSFVLGILSCMLQVALFILPSLPQYLSDILTACSSINGILLFSVDFTYLVSIIVYLKKLQKAVESPNSATYIVIARHNRYTVSLSLLGGLTVGLSSLAPSVAMEYVIKTIGCCIVFSFIMIIVQMKKAISNIQNRSKFVPSTQPYAQGHQNKSIAAEGVCSSIITVDSAGNNRDVPVVNKLATTANVVSINV